MNAVVDSCSAIHHENTRAALQQTAQQAVTLDVSVHGRDEMNLARIPHHRFGRPGPKGTKTLIFRASQGQLTITGSDAFGLPTALDADVMSR